MNSLSHNETEHFVLKSLVVLYLLKVIDIHLDGRYAHYKLDITWRI